KVMQHAVEVAAAALLGFALPEQLREVSARARMALQGQVAEQRERLTRLEALDGRAVALDSRWTQQVQVCMGHVATSIWRRLWPRARSERSPNALRSGG